MAGTPNACAWRVEDGRSGYGRDTSHSVAARLVLLAVILSVTACGGVSALDGNFPAAPTIQTFVATPASLPAGGGTTTLSWTVTYADTLSLAPGIGNVGGLSSKAVSPTANTTYTLTASNSLGQARQTVTVTVGP
jgi:hypothetical protein